MRVKIIACPIGREDFDHDPEQAINAALDEGWYLRDTHVAVSGHIVTLVAVLVDDVEVREVVASVLPHAP